MHQRYLECRRREYAFHSRSSHSGRLAISGGAFAMTETNSSMVRFCAVPITPGRAVDVFQRRRHLLQKQHCTLGCQNRISPTGSSDLGHRFLHALNRGLRTPAKGVASKARCELPAAVPASCNARPLEIFDGEKLLPIYEYLRKHPRPDLIELDQRMRWAECRAMPREPFDAGQPYAVHCRA